MCQKRRCVPAPGDARQRYMRAEPATVSRNTRPMQSAAYSVMQGPQSGPAFSAQTDGLSVPAAKHLGPAEGQGDGVGVQGFQRRVHVFGGRVINITQKGKGQMQVFRGRQPPKGQAALNAFKGLNGVFGQTQGYEQTHAC